tara:strand:- start:1038 stop:1307 length:270 start_codon:yes stop_codon:yes gene_type:complete
MPRIKAQYPNLPPVPAVEGLSASPALAFEEGWNSGCLSGWEDGYRAACETIQSMNLISTFGSEATPDYAQKHTLEIVKAVFPVETTTQE